MEATLCSQSTITTKEKKQKANKPFVSIVIPAYNEENIIEKNLTDICNYMEKISDEYDWELILVNDGSTDDTGRIAEKFCRQRKQVFVLHHFINFHIGQALRFAFKHCRGDYIVTMDIDLSYSPDHIAKLLKTIRSTRAKIVVASPYMEGGEVINVPFFRKILSKWANRFLAFFANGNISTITGMVRVYDRRFLNTMNLKAMDYEVNSEIIYKAQLLRALIVEIPAKLDWSFQKEVGKSRSSSMRIVRNIMSCIFSGFIFRPFMFFILPGLVLILPALYTIGLVVLYTGMYFSQLPNSIGPINYRLGTAVSEAFKLSPHAFIVSGILLTVSFQLISLGILSSQNKRYFDELFHLGTNIYKNKIEAKQSNNTKR